MTTSRKAPVTAAATVIVILAGLLILRIFAAPTIHAGRPGAAPATIPEPKSIAVEDIDYPQWFDKVSRDWPLEFRTDLDHIAPLGTGTTNAGLWFADFTRPHGTRIGDAGEAMKRRVPHALFSKILPGDDPLLLEAEPWCDQATMTYYPEVFEIDGWRTRVPDLLLQLTFARSWAARGLDADSEEAATADFRRAIRLGRLLRQDDVTIIADLVGLACIRVGLEGLYRWSAEHGRTEQAVLAAVALSEVAPQRAMTSERVTRVDISPYLERNDSGDWDIEIPDSRFEAILELAEDHRDRRFLGEVMICGNIVLYMGTDDQRARARTMLETLAASEDALIRDMARWSLNTPPGNDMLTEFEKPIPGK